MSQQGGNADGADNADCGGGGGGGLNSVTQPASLSPYLNLYHALYTHLTHFHTSTPHPGLTWLVPGVFKGCVRVLGCV